MSTSPSIARQMLSGHTIWLWHYLHADWQWEQSRSWHEERYALAVNEVLDLMRQNPEITYFFDTASEFFGPVERKLGIDVAVEALRETWYGHRATMDQLWHYARICRVANVMRPYLESLT